MFRIKISEMPQATTLSGLLFPAIDADGTNVSVSVNMFNLPTAEQLQKLQSLPDDAILDLGVVGSSTEAFNAAAAVEVVSNPRIRIIVWRTSDNKDDGGHGAGGTIFQERYGNWHVTQWMMFEGPKKICKARNITTGGNYNCGAWQNVVQPTKFAFDSSNATIKWGGIADESAERAVVSIPLVASNVPRGLMSKTDKVKLDALPEESLTNDEVDAIIEECFNDTAQ